MQPPSAAHVVPIHYEGWAHFKQGREAIERELETAPEDVRAAFRWVLIGAPAELAPSSCLLEVIGAGATVEPVVPDLPPESFEVR